jgi:hypothetical protein
MEQGSITSEPAGVLDTRVTLEERKKLAVEMYKGCDKIFKKHMDSVTELFSDCKKI